VQILTTYLLGKGGEMRIVVDSVDLQSLRDGFVASKIVKGVLVELVLHKNTKKHIHMAGTTIGQDIDKCAKCGLDIRDDIHIKIRPQDANMI
jgi:hypothetical protein